MPNTPDVQGDVILLVFPKLHFRNYTFSGYYRIGQKRTNKQKQQIFEIEKLELELFGNFAGKMS